MATLPTLLSQFNSTMKNQKIFISNIRIETQTVYNENGSINIYPCVFEENPHLVAYGDRASQRGRLVTEDDGTSCFRPYAVNSGSRYNTIFRTSHGSVKETKNDVIFELRFRKHLGKRLIVKMLREEQEELLAFVKSRRFKTKWDK